MFLGTIRNYLERFRNGSWIAAWNLGTVKNGSVASSWYSIFLDCFHLCLQRSFAYNFTKVLQKVCPVSWQIMNHQVYLQKCKKKYPLNMGKSQLPSASLCENVSWLRAYLLIPYLQNWPTPEKQTRPLDCAAKCLSGFARSLTFNCQFW